MRKVPLRKFHRQQAINRYDRFVQTGEWRDFARAWMYIYATPAAYLPRLPNHVHKLMADRLPAYIAHLNDCLLQLRPSALNALWMLSRAGVSWAQLGQTEAEFHGLVRWFARNFYYELTHSRTNEMAVAIVNLPVYDEVTWDEVLGDNATAMIAEAVVAWAHATHRYLATETGLDPAWAVDQARELMDLVDTRLILLSVGLKYDPDPPYGSYYELTRLRPRVEPLLAHWQSQLEAARK